MFFLLVNFPVIHPRCDKLTVVYLLFSNSTCSRCLNLMIPGSLMTTRILPYFFRYFPRQKPFTSFLSFFCFTIIPDNSNTSILIFLANHYMSLSFSNNWEYLFTRPPILSYNSICKDSLLQNWFKLFQLTSFHSQTWLLLLVCQGKFFHCNLGNFDILYNISNNYYNDILYIEIPWITMNYG